MKKNRTWNYGWWWVVLTNQLSTKPGNERSKKRVMKMVQTET